MKASAILAGATPERPTSYKIVTGKGITEVKLLLRALTALEEADVEAAAIAFAKKRGAPTTPGGAIYEAGAMGATLAIAVLDPDTPEGKREPYFDLGLEQVLALDPATLAQLHEQQRIWQDECSPSVQKMSVGEIMTLAEKIAQDNDPKAYSLLSPNIRWTLQRITGSLLAASRGSKPPSTSPASASSPGT